MPRKAVAAPAPDPEPVAPPRRGEYRCYWQNEWKRPCNKFLGMGSGPFERRCPRCKRQCAFEGPS